MRALNNRLITEKEIIDGCLKKQARCQKVLYDRFASKMFGVCLRYADCYHTAEDMLQEGFVRVFAKLQLYNGNGSFEGWVRRVVVNTAIDILRKKSVLNTSVELNTDIQDSGTELMLSELYSEDIMESIQKLPAGYRTILNLFSIEGYSHKEISELLNISESTSKSQLSRARQNLKNELSNLNKIKTSIL